MPSAALNISRKYSKADPGRNYNGGRLPESALRRVAAHNKAVRPARLLPDRWNWLDTSFDGTTLCDELRRPSSTHGNWQPAGGAASLGPENQEYGLRYLEMIEVDDALAGECLMYLRRADTLCPLIGA